MKIQTNKRIKAIRLILDHLVSFALACISLQTWILITQQKQQQQKKNRNITIKKQEEEKGELLLITILGVAK